MIMDFFIIPRTTSKKYVDFFKENFMITLKLVYTIQMETFK